MCYTITKNINKVEAVPYPEKSREKDDAKIRYSWSPVSRKRTKKRMTPRPHILSSCHSQSHNTK